MKNTSITENHLYQKAYRRGRSAVGRYIAVYVLRDRNNAKFVSADPCHRPLNRLGLTTGKKIGGAVVRSRARRLMREAYRLLERDGRVSHGYLLVIAARARIAEVGMNEVRDELCELLSALGVLIDVPDENGEK